MIEVIEQLISKQVGRNTQALMQYAKGGLQKAVQSLSLQSKIVITTGFFIPLQDQDPILETDGILGVVQMATAFKKANMEYVILVEESMRHVFDVLDGAFDLTICYVPLDAHISTLKSDLKRQGFTHLLACERSGAAQDGKHYSMRGLSVEGKYAKIEELFDGDLMRIAIGDGGNELGMGYIPKAIVERDVQNGGLIQAQASCDALIVAGVSNWGAFGLVKALGHHWQEPRLTQKLSVDFEREILEVCNRLGVIDGALGKVSSSVDGLFEDYFEVLEQIENL